MSICVDTCREIRDHTYQDNQFMHKDIERVRVCVSHPKGFGNNWWAYRVTCGISKDEASERSYEVSTDMGF